MTRLPPGEIRSGFGPLRGARGRADSPVSVMDVALDARLGGHRGARWGVNGRSRCGLRKLQHVPTCSKRSLRQIQNGDAKHVRACAALDPSSERDAGTTEADGGGQGAPALPLSATWHHPQQGIHVPQ